MLLWCYALGMYGIITILSLLFQYLGSESYSIEAKIQLNNSLISIAVLLVGGLLAKVISEFHFFGYLDRYQDLLGTILIFLVLIPGGVFLYNSGGQTYLLHVGIVLAIYSILIFGYFLFF